MAKNIEKVAVDQAEKQTTATADAREPPVMKSTCLTWQDQGQCFRHAFVRLPDGMLLQDLQDVPTIWKGMNSVPATALRKFDRVTAVSFDESWMIKDVVVIDADNTRAVLAIRPGDRITLSQKVGQWEDDKHVIRWAGSGFGVFRRSDGVQLIASTFGSIDAAKSVMYGQLYGRQVA
jgi:hypothetical protein